MTEAKANEILRTKYPEGRIFKRNGFGGVGSSSLAVIFKPNGKVYGYQAKSYQEVLLKLGFNVLYKHDVETMHRRIDELETKISDGGYKPILDFKHRDWVEYSTEDIEKMKQEISELESSIEESIIA